MKLIIRLLWLVALLHIVICFGCAVSRPMPTGESLRPGFDVVYRPVSMPEQTWNDVVAAYNSHDRFDRVWLAMKFDYLKRSNFNIRNFNFLENRVEITYVPVESGDNVGSKNVFTLYNYQLLKADLAVEMASESSIDQFAIFIPGVVAFRCRTLVTASKLADLLYFKQMQMQKFIEEKERGLALFAPVAAEYRSLSVKPNVSEEQRKLIVQANALTQQKNYQEALAQYKKVVELSLTSYPAAYYNLALLAAQENLPVSAVYYMKRYLLLLPDAKDARSAQDKIYEWEYLYQKK
ncbi:MAG: hypothetical protein IPQ16_02490 [Geobacteraceae bacterium]|nr:hypothetical protein [Geobacteraceae bacterium]